MAWLGEELPEKEQAGRTPFSPRCVKDVVEERLFAQWRDLLTRLDLVPSLLTADRSYTWKGVIVHDEWIAPGRPRPALLGSHPQFTGLV